MYQCPKCKAVSRVATSKCAGCGVLFGGVSCRSCGHTGPKSAFQARGNCCPKCGVKAPSLGMDPAARAKSDRDMLIIAIVCLAFPVVLIGLLVYFG